MHPKDVQVILKRTPPFSNFHNQIVKALHMDS